MRLIRTNAGSNDFVITNLTLGKLLSIKHIFEAVKASGTNIGPVADELLSQLNYWDIENITPFGDSHTDYKLTLRISPVRRIKTVIPEEPNS
jgi:hypothetical protein